MAQLLHEDELPIDVSLVRRLVDRNRPDFAALPLTPLPASGSTNALFRLGDEFLIRLPRQPGGTMTIEKEARWLPQLALLLPVPVPEIVAVGEPGIGYPERWSIVKWLDGDVPAVVDPGSDADPARRVLAGDLAAFVTALHAIDVPHDAVSDVDLHWYRGDPLITVDTPTRRNIELCRAIPNLGLDLAAASRVWAEAMMLPDVDRRPAPAWYHGDLLAENLLVRDGRLAAVLDFGGLAVGDPTVDLIAAWEVLDAPARESFKQAVGVDEQTWLRGRAWALAVAVMTFPYYWHTMPARCAGRLAAARSILADAG
jgi:aminoglycoside phosphotransferase (APT) family kinase protein